MFSLHLVSAMNNLHCVSHENFNSSLYFPVDP